MDDRTGIARTAAGLEVGRSVGGCSYFGRIGSVLVGEKLVGGCSWIGRIGSGLVGETLVGGCSWIGRIGSVLGVGRWLERRGIDWGCRCLVFEVAEMLASASKDRGRPFQHENGRPRPRQLPAGPRPPSHHRPQDPGRRP